jgi:GntR family transcriptional regulator, histidine utilization repressor
MTGERALHEKPGFRTIKREVFRRIRSNEWGPGTLLPGEVELAAEFGCARATVNRAMQELSDDGIIERRRKGGSRVKLAPVRQVTFEIPIVRAEVEARGQEYRYEPLSSNVETAPKWLQAKLNLLPATRMRHITCLHHADGKAFQFEDRWINLSAVPRAEKADFSHINPNEWLVSEVPYTNAEIRFSASKADSKIARLLKTSTGEPLFMAERTTWLAQKPVTHVKLHFAPGYQMIATY